MKATAALSTDVPAGAYPERGAPREGWVDRGLARARRRFRAGLWGRERARSDFVQLVEAADPGELSTPALRDAARELRPLLRLSGFRPEVAARAFALARHAAHSTLGQRPYDVQAVGGWVLLNGMIAEMETGEGKTLTATLPACTVALAGHPVHVITVNDYLAARDAEAMGPVYRALGLTVGVVLEGMSNADRRAAYRCDVTYATNKQIVFDYLRDRIHLGRDPSRPRLLLERLSTPRPRLDGLLLRGLSFGIVDEADSVLIDEARTPLIISNRASAAEEERAYHTARELAEAMEKGLHFRIDTYEQSIRLEAEGRTWLEARVRGLGGMWSNPTRREDLVRQALTAQHLFHRDRHYIVQDGKVQIVDEYTGRVMADRSWERGLHQAIETKEDCALTVRTEPLARISYQAFFRRYLRLAGLTGTAREVAGELSAVYGLTVVRVPTNRPLRRQDLGGRAFATAEAKWQAVVERIREVHGGGRPVLVGTRSVEASEQLSRYLDAAGLAHRVLNARQDADEAAIVAEAGQAGRITVATNMAGRGTDIVLGPGIAELGGLHVIATERHDARRIDRQLFGRCGRQGDPGSYEILVSLEDELVEQHGSKALGRAVAGRADAEGRLPAWAGALAVRQAQGAAERKYSATRRDLLRVDEHRETSLAFTGSAE